MITVLSGAKRNVGDFLITERAEQLLALLGEPIQRLPNWEPLDVEAISESRLLVIAGGPGLRRNLYPGVYPLLPSPRELSQTGVKLAFLGSGGKLQMGDAWEMRRFNFMPESRKLFESFRECVVFSTRDDISTRMLKRNGHSAVMTGCPVWYRQDCFGQEPDLPKKIERIVFTEPRRPEMNEQSLKLLEALRRVYADAEIVASFHHGFDEVAPGYLDAVRAMGVETRDVAADTSKIAFYDDFDLHVGYRVHAGLYFLSRRKPSIIISEDMRGRGSAEALGIPWVNAWRYSGAGIVPRRMLPYDRVAMVLKRSAPFVVPRGDVSEQVLALLAAQSRRGWQGYRHLSARIDGHFHVMRDFIETL